VACLIDFSRLAIYSTSLSHERPPRLRLVVCGGAGAFLEAALGNYLKKMTMPGIQRIVAVMLFVVALGLVSGLL
jgi:hypothetical protein